MSSGRSLPQINLGVQGGIQRDSHSGAQRNINSELRVGSSFRVIPEQFFSGVENVTEFLDNNLTYYEIPTQLTCVYLKGHLTGRTLDWFQVLGYKVVEEKATDYAQLKPALTEQFPVVRNRSELETRFYVWYQNHNQRPSEFVYELLKIHKLKLDMAEEKFIDHIISRLESKLSDYVERDTRVSNRYSDNSRPQRESNRFGAQGVGDNRRFDSRRRSGQSDHRFNNHVGRQGGSRNGAFRDSPEAYRFAIDYRKLNAINKYPRYPLPLIDDLITNIPFTTIMSTLDLKLGYFQLAIYPRDMEKLRLFAFNRMPFGLSGTVPNFQKAIDMILKPVLGHFVSVYMNDVIITSPSFTEHVDHLNQVFTLLRDAGLTLNKNKCHFAHDKLKYLGLIISKDGIKTNDNKVKLITEMKPPKNNREVSKFLGMSGWYQKFIQNYADICEPLYRLKKKGAKFNWSMETQDSFNKVKQAITEAPVL
ncbi:retrovirus-related Pol polyprotein from transposon 297 [Trichonephila clavipes]|nr:retrovirus-related Pol polyprotein from transposon 297 [Trichonephila clavipes]